MHREKLKQREKQAAIQSVKRMPAAKYLSSIEVSNVLRLLSELVEITQSASSHALAKQLISELGGPNWQMDDRT